MNDEQYLKYVLETFDNYKAHRKNTYDQRFIDNYKLFKSYRNPRAYNWQSNVFLPFAFSTIETILPRIVEYIFRGDRFVTAFPRGIEDFENNDVVDDLIQYQIDTQIENLFLEMTEHYKQSLIYGTGVGKLTWDVDSDKPEFSSLDIFDVYVEPHKKYIEQSTGIFHVYDRPIDYLMQRQMMGIGYKNVEALMRDQKSTSVIEEEESKKAKLAESSGVNNQYKTTRPSALIYEYWGKVPIQDRIDVDNGFSSATYKEMMCMIANRRHLIRFQANPYITQFDPDGFRPFIVSKNYIDPGEFYALGDIDDIKDIQFELNELENQSLDNIKLIMNRMWKVSNTAGIDLGTLVSQPGAIFQMNNTDDLEQIDHNDLPASASNEKDNLRSMLQMVSGVSDYSKGVNAPGMTDTVGGISGLIEEANMRFALKIKILQMTSIADFANILFKLDKIFIKDATLPIRLQGDKGVRWLNVNPDNLAGMYDFKAVSISMVGNRIARQNTLLRMLDVLKSAPPVPSMLEQILDEFEFKNKDSIMQDMMKIWYPPMPAMPPGGVPQVPAQGGR
jgi:hypothetical protein